MNRLALVLLFVACVAGAFYTHAHHYDSEPAFIIGAILSFMGALMDGDD